MSDRTVRRLPIDTGSSGWLALSERRMPVRVLDGDRTADWLIIGAGFAGLSAARRLTQLRPGETIVMLDAREVAQGPAGRNSGFMIDLPHDLTSGEYSPGDAAQAKQEIAHNRLAIGFAANAAAELGMSTATFSPCGKTNAAATPRGEKLNADFARALARAGEPFKLLDARAMRALTGTTYYTGGLHTPGACMIQPADYIRTLAASLRGGVDIFENSPVVGLRREARVWAARTPSGTVRAPKAILAVNGHIEDFGHFAGHLMHIFTYASMTRALRPGMAGHGQTGAAAWGLLPADPMGATVRKISPSGEERIVIRTRFTFDPGIKVSEGRIAKIAGEQRRSFDARFPQLGGLPFEFSWAGRLCLSRNHVPAFGEVEEELYSACCENGLGTVKSTLAGMMAAELATGTRSAILEDYAAQPAPKRLPPVPLAYLGINSVIRWQELRAGREG
ncbi:NAD(P)/FAD-dependent oxidoreductase [Lichenifustis flavocetrariae]|uniref:FAD-binding oxidoreductase n=1 Tax=Lichenifustis flavocetrariae TaxID=2949735 RepID=A0AA41Z2S3_9HYPH|nr:FAD-binding oxidoreductase [Lichenifustis flavocetrariae]MCW6512669.1 FAD-binding oxidoreductase [Lichenifustis flavocetrariae]